MLNTHTNRALLCALIIHTTAHAFRIPFFSDFADFTHNFASATTRSSISIEEAKGQGENAKDTLLIRVTEIDLASGEDNTTPPATLEKTAHGRHQNIEIPVSGGSLRIVIEDRQFVQASLTRHIERYHDHEGIINSSVQQESISRSYGVDRPLLEDAYEINYNKADRALVIRLPIDAHQQAKEPVKRVPVNITVQE